MKTLLKVFSLIILTLILQNCKDKDCPWYAGDCVYSIKIQNNSNRNIIAFEQLNYPDTTIQSAKPYWSYIKANSYSFIDSKEKWENVINSNAEKTLQIFIMDFDTVQGNDWSDIVKDYKILKRFELKLEDLTDWTVNYEE